MTAVGLILVVSSSIAGALEVSAPAGCVDPIEVGAALDEIGGIDLAETVRVEVTPNTDEYKLVVDIALAQAAPLHREVPLRPRECPDVADLVAVLVQSQRRAALEARLLAEENAAKNVDEDGAPKTGVPPPKPALPAMDPRTRGAAYPGTTPTQFYDGEGWSPCDGPAQCGSFRLGVSVGGAYPIGARGALDTGWDLTPNVTVIAGAETMGGNDAVRAGAGVGLAYRTQVEDIFELSMRGMFGAGGGTKTIVPTVLEDAECVPDGEGGGTIQTLGGSTVISRMYLAPTIAMRGRIGYVFAEVGTTWHVLLDDGPMAYAAIGFAPVGH